SAGVRSHGSDGPAPPSRALPMTAVVRTTSFSQGDERVFDRGPRTGLVGRRSGCEVLDRLVTDVRAHQSRALVLRGEAGVGKTALMDHVVSRSSGCRVVRAAGVESEMELAFA